MILKELISASFENQPLPVPAGVSWLRMHFRVGDQLIAISEDIDC